MKFQYLLMGVIALLAISMTSCKKKKVNNLKSEVIINYADIVYASYDDAHSKAIDLQTAIENLVNAPSQTTHDAAKQAWLDAREPYGQTEVYRFYDGPIDDTNGPEGNLNAWPLDENYIDYVRDGQGGISYGGIIYDTTGFPTIDAVTLTGANEQGGEKNISIGYHAIEFLLWGQDFEDVTINEGEGGDRSYTDYSTASQAVRRGQYLKVCAELIVQDLATLKSEWAEGGNYRNSFLELDEDEALSKILTGAGVLSKSELAGERMFVALEANPTDNPQEDEHSCFADNTHRDIITNAMGINNILSGTYEKTNGTIVGDEEKSIVSLLELVDRDLASQLSSVMDETMTKVKAIPAPFDKTVTNETISDNGPVLQAINALQGQGDKIAETATALGFTISTDLPE